MNDFIDLIKEGFRLAANLGTMAVGTVKAAVLAYFDPVKKWTIRLAIAAAIPLIVIVPCLIFHLSLGGFYGTYVVWIVILAAAELLLLTPMFFIWRRLNTIFPDVAAELREWLDFIISVVFNGLSLGIFVTLFPVWRAPGAFPLLLIVLVCWLTLPACGFSKFCKRIYPTLRAVQLVLLFGLLILQMAFPRHMDQLSWSTTKSLGKFLASPIEQKEITSKWKSVQWFDNQGEPQVWYSSSEGEGYHLWTAPGFDPKTGRELQPVKNKETLEKIATSFAERERKENYLQALKDEGLRQQAEAEKLRRLEDEKIRQAADETDRIRLAADEAKRLAEQRLQTEAAKARQMEVEKARQAAADAERIRLAANEANRLAKKRRLEKAETDRVATATRRATQSKYLWQIEGNVTVKQPRLAIVVASQNQPDTALTEAVSRMASRSGFSALGKLFKTEFISDGSFDRAFTGGLQLLNELDLTNHCEYLAMCQLTTTTQSVNPLHIVDGKFQINLFRCTTGALLSSHEYAAEAKMFDVDKALPLIKSQFLRILATNSFPPTLLSN